METVYGTKNQAKLATMARALAGLDVMVVGLAQLGVPLPEPPETGATPLENARLKAWAYYQALGRPVFSCDSGLYFENIPDDLQPGVHVRNVGGRYLSDDEMIAHYGALAARFGDLKARYRNAICLVCSEETSFESMEEDLSGNAFLLTAAPHARRVPGFPLDSLSVHLGTGRYYYDMPGYQSDDIALDNGFRRFFERVLAK